MANVHLEFEYVFPQFSGKINEQIVESVTDVKLWEAEHEDQKLRRWPRFYRRGLLGQADDQDVALAGRPSERHCG